MSTELIPIIGAFIVSACCGFIFIPALLKFCEKKKLYDIPTARKVHKTLVPRLGGIAFMPSMMISALLIMYVMVSSTGDRKLTFSFWSVGLAISLLMIYTIGIIDDLIGLDAKIKLVVQILAACIIPLCGLYINNLYGLFGINEISFWIGAPLTVFMFVFIDNAINLIDGIDGLSGCLSIIALLGFLFCIYPYSLTAYEILISGLIGVLFTYLYFNIFGKTEKNNKIFMGDAGSLTLGFILAFLFIKTIAVNPNVMPMSEQRVLIAYSLLIVPTFDVVRVVIHRLRLGRSIFSPDKCHIHHKMMGLGMNQHYALTCILGMAIGFILLNVALHQVLSLGLTPIMIIDIIAYTLLNLAISYKANMKLETNI